MALLKTFTEAAKEIGCTEKTLRRAVIEGDLNVVRFGTSSRSDRIHPDDLTNFINQLRQRGQTTCQKLKRSNQLLPEETHSISTSRIKAKQLDQLLATKLARKI